MNGRNILIALVVLLVLGCLYFFLIKRDDYTPVKKVQLFAELRNAIEPGALTRITMQKTEGDKELVLEKKDGEWTLPKLYSYPANEESVDELVFDLMKLGEERLVGQNPESHPDFEIGAEKGKTLKLEGSGGKELCSLVVGKSEPGSMNRGYVRIGGANEVYSATPSFSWKLKAMPTMSA